MTCLNWIDAVISTRKAIHSIMKRVRTGLESLLSDPPSWIMGQRMGLLCNPASVDANYRHARLLINDRFPGQLRVLFFPQHGLFSEKQDNMIESADCVDPVLDVPAFSLYGKSRTPDRQMFDHIDTLLVDLQDVGTRVYTFATTLSYCMEAAKRYTKKILILDRPNPVGGLKIEGNCLVPACRSFVGRYPIPMRHGMTLAEYALMINDQYSIGCDLHISAMSGWKRQMLFADTGLPWVAPSPNLPTPLSAMVYPGQVIWEGTHVSEGRGTTQPFECFGAPYIAPQKILSQLGNPSLPGVVLRELAFEPTANKWQGSLCRGFQLHIMDADAYQPYETSLRLLQAVIANHSDSFQWKDPPYEYEFERLPIDLIMGDADIRKRLENLEDPSTLFRSWQPAMEQFGSMSRHYHLYGNE
jgi:uncharacterized protein YbbC (DUF1343 family)